MPPGQRGDPSAFHLKPHSPATLSPDPTYLSWKRLHHCSGSARAPACDRRRGPATPPGPAPAYREGPPPTAARVDVPAPRRRKTEWGAEKAPTARGTEAPRARPHKGARGRTGPERRKHVASHGPHRPGRTGRERAQRPGRGQADGTRGSDSGPPAGKRPQRLGDKAGVPKPKPEPAAPRLRVGKPKAERPNRRPPPRPPAGPRRAPGSPQPRAAPRARAAQQ